MDYFFTERLVGYHADRACFKRFKTLLCPSVRPSVRLSQGQRARQQQSRAAAGDAHRRLHTTRGPRKFRTDGKEVQHSLVALYCVVSVEHYHKPMT